MINPKMAREWQKVAAIRRKRISLPRTHQDLDAGYCSTSSVADKGHFVVYTADQRRFMIPIVYLNSEIFRELFEMSEEEFGLPSDGPITLPCDSFFMEYIIFLVQRGVAKDLEKALLTSVAYTQSSSSFFSHQEQMNSRLLVCSYWINDSLIFQMINTIFSLIIYLANNSQNFLHFRHCITTTHFCIEKSSSSEHAQVFNSQRWDDLFPHKGL